ncbi:hypothetical protein [uncultured Sphingomonas sp.]|uniref:hypothetical protein n=1 Tax=uncultured Sphingomonas sp. TaxID=158754 RepID=UPI0025FA4D8D|nr:hypothetical protein [uncultured Sphingomonas sp.]
MKPTLAFAALALLATPAAAQDQTVCTILGQIGYDAGTMRQAGMSQRAAAGMLAIASPAAAEPGSIATCTSLSEAAQTAMMVCQSGLPIHSVMNQLAGALDGTDLQLAILMMEAAYERPLFSSEDYKVQAANEFASDMFRMCRED